MAAINNQIKNPILKKSLKKLGYRMCVIINALVLTLIFPVLLLLCFLPMWITRQGVKLLAKVIHPELCGMSTCATTTCANANGTDDNPRMVTLVELQFQDKLDIEQVAMAFNSQAVEKLNKNGKLQYPQLQQYLTSWLGFRFWKKDSSFSIKNHVIALDKDSVTLENLRDIEEELLCKPFGNDKSPWEILVIPNTLHNGLYNCTCDNGNDITDNLKTTVIFRYSHILADGYSVKKLLEGISTVEISPKLKINYPTRSFGQKLVFPLKFYYTMAEVQILSLLKYPFKVNDHEKSQIYTLQTSDVIPLNKIRDIKDKHGVSFTSVIISLVTGAFRRLGEMQNLDLTDTIPCAIPLPKPGHPDALTNHFTLAVMNIPIGESSPIKRLNICHKELLNLRSSAYPAAAACFMTVFGSFFTRFGQLFGTNTFSAVNISYLPSGLENISFLGANVIGQTWCMGIQKGSIGAVVTVSSYKDRVQMHATIDTNVIAREKVMQFKTIINQEVEALLEFSNFHDV